MAGATILILWGCLYLAFRDWRSRYRARAQFGATQVAPVIDALAGIEPPGLDGQAWRDAVRETHSMLVTVTGANLLDVPQMQSLRAELEQAVARARARPETARDELAGVWNAMSDPRRVLAPGGEFGATQGPPPPCDPAPTAREAAEPEIRHADFGAGIRRPGGVRRERAGVEWSGKALVLGFFPGNIRRFAAPSLLEGIGERQELLHAERLGADLAVEAEGLEPELDLGLGPPVAHMPDSTCRRFLRRCKNVLRTMSWNQATSRSRASFGDRADHHDGGFDLGPRPEDRRGQDPHDRDLGQGLDQDGERAVVGGRRRGRSSAPPARAGSSPPSARDRARGGPAGW